MLIKINYRILSLLLLYLYLIFIYVGLNPFSLGHESFDISETDSSNSIKQFIFIFLFVFSSVCNYKLGKIFKIKPISGMLIFMLWVVLSTTWSLSPSVSFRRSMLLIINIFCVYNFVNIYNREEILNIITKVFVFLLFSSYVGLLLFPGSVHVGGDFIDSDIVGSWKGIYQHKNQAGPAMVISIFLFVYSYLKTRNKKWILFVFLAFIFLVFTKSKSSLILLIPSFLLGVFLYCFQIKKYRIHIYVSLGFIVALLFVISDDIFYFFNYLISDPESFTGRAEIWYILTQVIKDHFLFGLGFGSVWLIGDNMIVADYIVGWNDWIYSVAHSHSGYFEVFTSVGFIGFIIAMIVLVFDPMIKLFYLDKNKDRFLFYSIFIFFLFHNLLETDFINSIDGRWIFFLFFYFNIKLNFPNKNIRDTQ